ncbi:hypothetical protein AB0M91_01460 [Micromonospora rifamycinica]|uniref:hypothetical protein n=1 Tax=Micromonospora rifamycinica TaxID=291594 RepID=UPI0034399F35
MPPRRPKRAKGQRRPAEPPPQQPAVPQPESQPQPAATRQPPEPPAVPRSEPPATPQPAADEPSDAAADRSTRRKLLLAAGGAAASAVIGTVVAGVYDRLTSSEKAVRDDRAIEQAKRTDTQRKPPIAVNAYYYNRSDEAVAWVLPAPLTSGQRQELLTLQRSLDREGPENFPDVVYGVVRFAGERPSRLLTRIRISAVGQWTGPVFVRQIRARVLKRSAPLSDTFLYQGGQGDGAPLKIGFDLDEPESIARVIREKDETLGAAYVDRRALTLTPGEPMTIDIQAYTDRSYCEWVVELELDLQGEKRLQVVDDHGRPFRSTGLARHYRDRYYVHIRNGWTADGAGPPVGKL